MKIKKIKKIILTILCFIILLVPCLSMNVFALQEVWFACDKPTVTENSGYVEVACEQGNFVFVVYSYLYDYSKFYCTVDSNGYLYFYCEGDNGTTIPCYSYYVRQDGKAIETPYWSSGNYSYYRTYDIYKINGYNVDVSKVSASVPSNPYSFYYSSDVIINDTLQQILGVLSANSGNAQQIIDGINSNNNANTDKIIQNQEENQEEITNGWQQDEEIDTSTTDDYAAKDQELQGATEQGRSEAVSLFNSFGSMFQSDGHLYKGLMSVSAIMNEFLKIDWLSSILNFALALGVFAFVIGTGSQIFKSVHERSEERKIDKIDSYDERWLM